MVYSGDTTTHFTMWTKRLILWDTSLDSQVPEVQKSRPVKWKSRYCLRLDRLLWERKVRFTRKTYYSIFQTIWLQVHHRCMMISCSRTLSFITLNYYPVKHFTDFCLSNWIYKKPLEWIVIRSSFNHTYRLWVYFLLELRTNSDFTVIFHH